MSSFLSVGIPMTTRKQDKYIGSTTEEPLVCNNVDEADRPTHNMNYYVLIIFHADVDRRPCRPIVRVVHLPKAADTLQKDLHSNPNGIPILTTCQLCDPCINTPHALTVDMYTLLSVYALAITDTEANSIINNVAEINTNVSSNQIVLTHRSNISLVPRWLHRSIQIGVRSIAQVRSASSVTDVQLCILLLRESFNSARSLSVQLRSLHPSLATPENFKDALTLFTRAIDVSLFKKDAFKFEVLV
jgi:hypothetical protein